jgi:hypothetical protein
MQGTFCREKSLSVPADIIRRIPTWFQPQPDPNAPPIPGAAAGPAGAAPAVATGPGGGAAAVAAAAAAAGGGLAPPPPAPPVVVHHPLQRFSIDGCEFFIEETTPHNILQKSSPGGYWLVPHVIDSVTQNARPFRSENVLPDELKFPIGLPSIAGMVPYPDRDYSRLGVHFVANEPNFYSIKFSFVKNFLDEAEKRDYEFATRMQGLQNCSINAVWTCVDLGFDAYDRSLIMEQFMRGYVGRFLSKVSQKPGRELNPDNVVQEAIQMHERFCEAWVKEHKRGLSPLIESCAEALVGNFSDGVLKPAINLGMTRKEISRMLRRDPILSPQFGLCLHFFMVKIDQDRSGRNANYKSMYNSMSSNILAMKTFENFMRSHVHIMMGHIHNGLDQEWTRRFHPLTVNWYSIVTQLHAPKVRYTGVNKKRRVEGARGAGAAMDDELGPGGFWD